MNINESYIDPQQPNIIIIPNSPITSSSSTPNTSSNRSSRHQQNRQLYRLEHDLAQEYHHLDDLCAHAQVYSSMSHPSYTSTGEREERDKHALSIDVHSAAYKQRKHDTRRRFLNSWVRKPTNRSKMIHLNDLESLKMRVMHPFANNTESSTSSQAAVAAAEEDTTAAAAGPASSSSSTTEPLDGTAATTTTTSNLEEEASTTASGQRRTSIETRHRPSFYQETKTRVDSMLDHLATFADNYSAFTGPQQDRLNRLTHITLHINSKLLYIVGLMLTAGFAFAGGATAFFTNAHPVILLFYAGGLSALANASGYLLATVYAGYRARAEDEKQNVWNDTRILYRNISFRLLHRYLTIKFLDYHEFSKHEALAESMRRNKLSYLVELAQKIEDNMPAIARDLALYFRKKFVYEILDPLLQVTAFIIDREPLTDTFLRNEENTLLQKFQLQAMKQIMYTNRELIHMAIANKNISIRPSNGSSSNNSNSNGGTTSNTSNTSSSNSSNNGSSVEDSGRRSSEQASLSRSRGSNDNGDGDGNQAVGNVPVHPNPNDPSKFSAA